MKEKGKKKEERENTPILLIHKWPVGVFVELLKLIAHYTACYNFQCKLLNSEKNSHDRAGH